MKKIFLIVIIYSSLFSQDVLITIRGNEFKGKLIEKTETGVSFLTDGDKYPQIVPIRVIKKLILQDGTIIISIVETFTDNSLVALDTLITIEESFAQTNSNMFTDNIEVGSYYKIASGVFLSLSGILLYSVNNMEEPDTIDDLEDFFDKQKLRSDMAYLSMAVSGILLILDDLDSPEKGEIK
ncbi:MAG: hypothetical protein H8E98_03185 [Bacteroidetes bacterium]|nr:hypothetical protein [Bacteroidota bacterium]